MSSDPLIGQALGQYQIRMVLGGGGMSTVYLGYQPNMDRPVAIKVLPREFLHDPTFLMRFQQEARTIAKLEHLHILPVYDAGEHEGIPYIVMRYLPGGTFADLIAERLPPYATTVRIMAQIADALDYAHEREIIHRDLKPSNILLDNGQNAYLADFGIARLKESANITGSRVMGTPPYIAPEMVHKDGVLTPSVDIYALGIIVFEAITGRPPFIDDDPMKTLMMHAMEPVPSARKFDPRVKPEIDEVLMKALAKTPNERYKTAGAFASALAKAVTPGKRPGDATPPGGRERRTMTPSVRTPAPPKGSLEDDVPTPSSRAPSRIPWIVAAGLAALIGGLVLTAFAMSSGRLSNLFGGLGRGNEPTRTPTLTLTPGPNGGSTAEPATTEEQPVVVVTPGGGTRLVFASERDGNPEIYLVDADGGNLTRLTRNLGADYDPAWSPDGTKIAYASTAEGSADIWVMAFAECLPEPDTCGVNSVALTDSGGNDFSPDWSPDGTQIVFASNRDGNFEIYVMQSDGSAQRRLTNSPADDASPHWSPRGDEIVYSTQDGSNSTIYTLPINGGDPVQLTGGDGLDLWPSWSPDGQQIVYTSNKNLESGQRALFILDVPSGTLAQITDNVRHDDDPTWSPDGRAIAFDSDRDGDGFDLYIYNILTREITRLIELAGDDYGPAWQPR